MTKKHFYLKKRLFYSFLLLGPFLFSNSLVWGVEALEQEIKATYLYNFAKFVDWPPGKSKYDPLVICVTQKSPVRSSLEFLAKNKSIKERPLQVHLVDKARSVNECNILYLTTEDIKSLPGIKQKLSSKDLLSVGEAPNFLTLGGQVQFFIEKDKVGFEFNLSAVERAGLKVDARVLNLARVRQ